MLLLLPHAASPLQPKTDLESRYNPLFLLNNYHIISLCGDLAMDLILNSDVEIRVHPCQAFICGIGPVF